MTTITVGRREMHLAAYMKHHGATLVGANQDGFQFDTDRPLNQWRIAHSNSCCLAVDRELLTLKRLS